MATNDIDVQLELLNLDSVVKALSSLSTFTETDKEVSKGLTQGARHLINKGRQRLRARMKSGFKGVRGNLLRSFTYRMKKRNSGVLTGFSRKGSHSWLVSEGTKVRKNRGKVIGNKFWSDTRNQDTNVAMSLVLQSIQKSINNLKNRYNA